MPPRIVQATAEWIRLELLKRHAHRAVLNEINAGRMPKAKTLSCSNCDNRGWGYHHHNGYEPAYWLDVVPVCRNCHLVAHRS